MKYQREVTAAVLIPAVLAILIAAPLWAWSLLVAAACLVALLEFYAMLEKNGLFVPKLLGILAFFAAVVSAYFRNLEGLAVTPAAVLLLVPTLVLFASLPEPIMLSSAANSVFATLYVSLGAAAVIGLKQESWKPVLFLLVIVWAGDSAAYYTGKKWGKRKLAPVVSPKKSWEGFWGQIVGGALAAALVAGFISGVEHVLLALPVGAVLSGAAVVGDLVESTFKRSCTIKDSGGLLPGHGGLLDRLDSLLYASPVAYAAFLYLPGGFLK